MNFRRAVGVLASLATVAVGGTILAPPGPSYAGATTGPRFPLKEVDRDVIRVLRGSGGEISGIAAVGGPIEAEVEGTAEDVAAAHLRRYASKFGVSADDLEPVATVDLGNGTAVRFTQEIEGLPVLGGDLIVSTDEDGGLEAIVGETVSGGLDTTTFQDGDDPLDLMPEELRATIRAREYVAQREDLDSDELTADIGRRAVYNPTLIGAPGPNVNREVYVVTVTSLDGAVSYDVLVDRRFGSVTLAMDNRPAALRRFVCDTEGVRKPVDEQVCDGKANAYVRSEGEGASGVADVDAIYRQLGATARWYREYVGADLAKLVGDPGAPGGAALRATARICPEDAGADCPEPNAYWDWTTRQLYYGEGFTALDITAHELTHGVTNATSGLLYAYQSGAISEALSDIFAELIDLSENPGKRTSGRAWQIGEDLPAGTGYSLPLRSLADPTSTPDWQRQPDRMSSDHWDSDPGFVDSGGVHTNSGPLNKAAYLIAEGGRFNGYDVDGLGIPATFKIFWTVQHLLSSGADYQDVYHVLPLACEKNIGDEGITAASCREVRDAVRAVELGRPPAKGAPVSVAACESGAMHGVYRQGFDARPEDWTMSGGARLTRAWGFDNVRDGRDSLVLYTYDGSVARSSATSEPLTVPSGGRLWLEYQTFFGYGTPAEGPELALEYDDGSGWRDAAALGGANAGPWRKHSKGWASARFDLSSLAGQKVRFRLTVHGTTGDPTFNPYAIANVDNLRLYTCR